MVNEYNVCLVEKTKQLLDHSSKENFHTTPAFLEAREVLTNFSVLFLTGFKGSGKTKTAMKLLQESSLRPMIFDDMYQLNANIFECPPALCFLDDIDVIGEHQEKRFLSTLLSLKTSGCINIQSKYIFTCDRLFLTRNASEIDQILSDLTGVFVDLSINNPHIDENTRRKILNNVIDKHSYNMADDKKDIIIQNLAKEHIPSFSLCTKSFLQLDIMTCGNVSKPISFDHYNLYRSCFEFIQVNVPAAFEVMKMCIGKRGGIDLNVQEVLYVLDVFLCLTENEDGIDFISCQIEIAFAQYCAFHIPKQFLKDCRHALLGKIDLDDFNGPYSIPCQEILFSNANYIMIESRYRDKLLNRLYEDMSDFESGSLFHSASLGQPPILISFLQKVCANSDLRKTSQCLLHVLSFTDDKHTTESYLTCFEIFCNNMSLKRHLERAIQFFSTSEVENAWKLMDVYASKFGKRSLFYMRQRIFLSNSNRSILPLLVLLPKRNLQSVHAFALLMLFFNIFMIHPIHKVDSDGFSYYRMIWSGLCCLFYILYFVFIIVQAIQKKQGNRSNSCVNSCAKLFDKCLFRTIFLFCQIQFYVIAFVVFIFMCRGLKDETSWAFSAICILKVILASVYRYSKPKTGRDYVLHTLQIIAILFIVIIALVKEETRIYMGIFVGFLIAIWIIGIFITCLERKIGVEMMSVPL